MPEVAPDVDRMRPSRRGSRLSWSVGSPGCPSCRGVLGAVGACPRTGAAVRGGGSAVAAAAGTVPRVRRAHTCCCRMSRLLRRQDEIAVIGAAIEAKVAGEGHRRIARPVGGVRRRTVRGWLRRFVARAGQVRCISRGGRGATSSTRPAPSTPPPTRSPSTSTSAPTTPS